jgi:hypothetical protein
LALHIFKWRAKFKSKEKNLMYLKYLKFLLVILILIAVINTGYGGPRSKLGTSAAPELLIPVGSIGTSLSGSNLSSITGVDAIYWNVAGLSQLNSQNAELLVSHSVYFADMNLQYIGVGARLGNLGNIGVSIKSLNIGDIEETTESMPEGTGVIYKPTYIVAGLSFAKQMTDRIRFGSTVKIINENVANVSSTGFAFDFGIQYSGGLSGLAFGIAIKNLGPSMRFDGPGLDRTVTNLNQTVSTQRVILQDYDLPTNLELGVSYKINLSKKMNLNVSTAFQNSSFSTDEYKIGLEYNYNNIFYIRGAGSYYPDKEKDESLFGPTFGAGIKYPLGSVLLGFDYAYRVLNESGFNSTNQFFTLNVGF